MNRPAWLHLGSAALLALAGSQALGQTVALQGMLGQSALLIVNGNPPKSVAVGQSHMGVKVLSTTGDQAVVDINGKRHHLRVGESPASLGHAGSSVGTKIVMNADSQGHFMVQGAINGGTVRFMVDTGASAIGLGAADADRLGLAYRSGQPIQMNTANGVAQGWRMRLRSVRIGEVEVYDVEAVISPQPMPFVLLGNSFLNRFQMRRDNELMTLERRY